MWFAHFGSWFWAIKPSSKNIKLVTFNLDLSHLTAAEIIGPSYHLIKHQEKENKWNIHKNQKEEGQGYRFL